MAKAKFTLTKTEISWIIMALNHDIAEIQHEVDHATSDLVYDLGCITLAGRNALKTKLSDIEASDAKIIAIV